MKINAIRIHIVILTAKQEYAPFYYPLKLANVWPTGLWGQMQYLPGEGQGKRQSKFN